MALVLVALRWIDPPSTALQVQRRIESWFSRSAYRKHYTFVPLERISPDLQHAVIAAEDARFHQHRGFDWHEIRTALDETLDEGRTRGASTITQQTVKNLLLTTHGGVFRKGVEFTLVPVAERVLGKRRILEIYLNVIEWGAGVYGAEEAARRWYGVSARRIGREQAARLAAILPAPRRRRPDRMHQYSARILERMAQMNW